jgi:hypothetical protein
VRLCSSRFAVVLDAGCEMLDYGSRFFGSQSVRQSIDDDGGSRHSCANVFEGLRPSVRRKEQERRVSCVNQTLLPL